MAAIVGTIIYAWAASRYTYASDVRAFADRLATGTAGAQKDVLDTRVSFSNAAVGGTIGGVAVYVISAVVRLTIWAGGAARRS